MAKITPPTPADIRDAFEQAKEKVREEDHASGFDTALQNFSDMIGALQAGGLDVEVIVSQESIEKTSGPYRERSLFEALLRIQHLKLPVWIHSEMYSAEKEYILKMDYGYFNLNHKEDIQRLQGDIIVTCAQNDVRIAKNGFSLVTEPAPSQARKTPVMQLPKPKVLKAPQ
ncbi:MAG: hypothetical protein OXT65_12730 [Alphaproteobacteria bacterium]|nr:hypothetical protein [Alphaproteobacteria bacterium]